MPTRRPNAATAVSPKRLLEKPPTCDITSALVLGQITSVRKMPNEERPYRPWMLFSSWISGPECDANIVSPGRPSGPIAPFRSVQVAGGVEIMANSALPNASAPYETCMTRRVGEACLHRRSNSIQTHRRRVSTPQGPQSRLSRSMGYGLWHGCGLSGWANPQQAREIPCAGCMGVYFG